MKDARVGGPKELVTSQLRAPSERKAQTAVQAAEEASTEGQDSLQRAGQDAQVSGGGGQLRQVLMWSESPRPLLQWGGCDRARHADLLCEITGSSC